MKKIRLIETIIFIILFATIILSNVTGLRNSLIFCGIIFVSYDFGKYIQKKKDNL